MADSEHGEKTEKPTAHRRQEAADRGQIARSQDLSSAVMLLGMLILLRWYGGGIFEAMRTVLIDFLSPASFNDFDGVYLRQLADEAIIKCAMALTPLLLGLAVAIILINFYQTGAKFSTKKLKINFAALNPIKGLKKLLSLKQSGMKLVINLAKLIAVSLLAYSAIHGKLAAIVMSAQLDYMVSLGLGAMILWDIGMRIGILLLILAIIDYIYQRWKTEDELKMTKHEVKDEMKRMDVDPKIRQRRRQVQMQQAMMRMQEDVPNADVVVTNPTEIAIALSYDEDKMAAPRVVAKGAGYMALKIRQLAIANGVPIVERKPLARALYKLVEVGQEIPEDFYATVAEILAYVWELSGKASSKRPRPQPEPAMA